MHADLGATSVYVTHDQIEAMTLASRIVRHECGIGFSRSVRRSISMIVRPICSSPASSARRAMNFLEGRCEQGADGSVVVLVEGFPAAALIQEFLAQTVKA